MPFVDASAETHLIIQKITLWLAISHQIVMRESSNAYDGENSCGTYDVQGDVRKVKHMLSN